MSIHASHTYFSLSKYHELSMFSLVLWVMKMRGLPPYLKLGCGSLSSFQTVFRLGVVVYKPTLHIC